MSDANPYGRSTADAKKMVHLSLRSIESVIGCARLFLATGKDGSGVNEQLDYRVNEALDVIAFFAQDAAKFTRVGPPVETLVAARNDRAVQRLIKKASRKAPI